MPLKIKKRQNQQKALQGLIEVECGQLSYERWKRQTGDTSHDA
jgi:hypothetical protein